MKLLFISNLFPNPVEPTRGVFNAQQVAALAKLCSVRVIAPTSYAVPNEPTVMHPRFRHIPMISRPFNGWLFARAIEPAIRREKFDVVLVNWAYPDAYGVMLVAEKLKFPFATTVQGSDVNVLFQNPTRKKQILRALRASRTVFCRSEALRKKLAGEGVAATTVYNGINREKFRHLDRVKCCRKLGLDPNRRRVLFVGNLLPVKGPMVLAHAAGQLRDVDVIFVGTGPERNRVERASSPFPSRATNGQDARSTIRCIGVRPHDEIPLWMNGCDVLCLPSLSEGLPNVVLEAMACGVPVVASRVGGVPEVVRDGVNGFMATASNPVALAEALRSALATKWDRDAIRNTVARFDWDVNARTVLDVLEKIACN